MLNEVSKGIVQTPSSQSKRRDRIKQDNLDISRAQLRQSRSADQRIGINRSDDTAAYPSGNERVRTRPSPPMVSAGLKRHIGSRTQHVVPKRRCLLERCNLGVIAEIVEVSTFAEDIIITRQHAANSRIRARKRRSILRKSQGSAEVELVLRRKRHARSG